MSEKGISMSEYVWTYNNGQSCEYVSYNIYQEVTLQVNEYLLRDGRIQNPVRDLRWSTLEK